jgi:hypothetical protein
MEQHPFVFGTGKSNLIKKRKARNDAPSVFKNTNPSIESSPDGDPLDGFEIYGELEEDLDTPPNLINIESFEETGPETNNPDELPFGFNNYLQGAKLIQAGLMKVINFKTDCLKKVCLMYQL